MDKISKIRLFEIIAVLCTAIGKFVFMDLLNKRLYFTIFSILFWVFYILYKKRNDTEAFKNWGFRTDNFKEVLRILFPISVFALALFFIIGYINNTLHMSWHILPLLLLYPLWGIIQQFLIIGLVSGNLYDSEIFSLNKMSIIIITATLFGFLHYPHYDLMGATFLLAILYGWIYTKCRNLYALGLFHGWLGALFYYTVTARDPFIEMFGEFL